MTSMKEQIRDIGQRRLAAIRPVTEGVGLWKAYLMDYEPLAEYPDDPYVWLTCTLALESVDTGNFGVGCILVDDGGDPVVQGHNQVFHPYFRSDRHAEMVVMERFEDANPEPVGLQAYTLYSSLEPCPMCLVRLIGSGIDKVLFAAADPEGGMVDRFDDLPPFWRGLARGKTFGRARCAPGLVDAAFRIFLLNLDALTARIDAR